MAADTLVVGNDIRRGRTSKLKRTEERLIGTAGGVGCAAALTRWIADGELNENKPQFPSDQGAISIVAYRDGRVAIITEKCVPQFCEAEFFACGSGNEIALGAMAMGATAEEAVRVAARLDVATEEPIEIIRFE